MSRRDLVSYQTKLDNLFKKVAAVQDLEEQSQWARYLCVLSSGYIELAVRTLYGEYAERKTEPRLAKYVTHQLSWFQNPNMEKILDLTSRFDPKWAQDLRSQVAGELEDSVNSLVSNKNAIAHGYFAGVSFVSVKTWYANAKHVVSLIESQCAK